MTKKEIELRLKVTADAGAGVKALDDVAKAAERVEKATGKAERALGGGGGGGSGGGGGNSGGSGGSSGLLGKIAGLSVAGVGLQQILSRAGQAAEIMGDSFASSEQKARGLFRLLPLGQTVQGLYDAFSGRKDAFQRAEVAHRQNMVGVQGEVGRMGFELGYNPQQAGLEARAAGLAGASPILEGSSDRSTAVGEKAFRDKTRMLSIERDSAKAEREAAVATSQRVAAQRELGGLESRSLALQDKRTKLEKELAGSPGVRVAPTGNTLLDRYAGYAGAASSSAPGGVDRQRLMNELAATDAEIASVGTLRRNAGESVAEFRKREAQAKNNAGMMGVRRLNAEAGQLEEDAANAAGGAQRLGGMDRFGRADAVQSLEMLQRFGPDMLDPSQIAAASSIAPQTVAKILERSGRGSAEFSRLQTLAPADFAGDPDALRRLAGEKRDEAAAKELELEKSLADTAVSAGRDLGALISKIMKEMTDAAREQIEKDMRRLRGATGS